MRMLIYDMCNRYMYMDKSQEGLIPITMELLRSPFDDANVCSKCSQHRVKCIRTIDTANLSNNSRY